MLKFLLSPWIFYFLMILGAALAIIVIIKATKLFITSHVWEKYNDNDVFAYDLLCAEFPDACILKDVPVTSVGAKNVQISQSLDILYVSRGGVLIISVVTGTGAFDNPKTGAWRYRYPDASGKPITVNIPNPFDMTIPAANILEGLLAGEKIFLDVNRIVVFTGKKIGLTNKYPEAVSVTELVDYIHAFDQRTVMNGPQFRTAATTITAFAEYNQHKNLSARHNIANEGNNPAVDKDRGNEEESNYAPSKGLESDLYEENDEAAALLKEIQDEIDKENESKNESISE